MEAFEFQTTQTNGYIKIPDEYAKQVGPNVRVILMTEKSYSPAKAPVNRSLASLVGVFKNVGEVDLQQSRMERLGKYENLD